MGQLRIPEHVLFDLRTFFDRPDLSNRPRIGVVTDLEIDGDCLSVRGGIGDGGLHTTLASQINPRAEKFLHLPLGMFSRQGTVRGWYDLQQPEPVSVVAGQLPDDPGLEPVLTYEQTDRCLRMAALALGGLLLNSPRELMSYKNPNSLMFGSAILAKLEKRIGDCIFE